MAITKLINGKVIACTIGQKGKALAIGSKLKWEDKVWEVIRSPRGCATCYFNGYGKCYRSCLWLEELGECKAIARSDNENVIFQLYQLKKEVL